MTMTTEGEIAPLEYQSILAPVKLDFSVEPDEEELLPPLRVKKHLVYALPGGRELRWMETWNPV
jgi:hypothetical protein|tara:strand:- start:281 stop:472 length:192 start_codon:yes stop_codon:yes gene_type:complete